MKVYRKTKNHLGFECKHTKKYGSWLRFEKDGDGLFVDKAYLCCEPSMTRKNIATFINWLNQLW
jgi:hypothetical protein